MKQKMIAIKYNTVTEMLAIRSVLKGFGYPIWHSFEHASDMGSFRHVRVDDQNVHRGAGGEVGSGFKLLTLEQFIENEGKPVFTPEQRRVAAVKAEIATLQQQIYNLQKQLATKIESL